MSNPLFSEAKKYIPGGVNSPVRAFQSVGGDPIFIERALGAYLYDTDQNQYIDYVGSWGPMILGHADKRVLEAVQTQMQKGLSYGAPTMVETQMAKFVCELLPWIEQIRMVNSGTEATMSAIRLARGFTKRDKIVKFTGCYHGHADSLLVNAGSGALTLGVPSSPGVPKDLAQHTLTADFNDLHSVDALFDKHGDDIAAIIMEPIAGNMNLILPEKEFLQGVRDLCDQYGALLIMDEVMTGFRVAPKGAQGLYGVYGDLSCFGKIIGGGMPVGAFGGRADVMSHLSPQGPVYQAGTLSGNPLAMVAGMTTLKALQKDDVYHQLAEVTQKLVTGIRVAASEHGVPLFGHCVGSMFGLFFTVKPQVRNFQDASQCHSEHFKTFFHEMLKRGVYFAPSAYESGFVSLAHTLQDIDNTIEAAREVFANMGHS